MATIKGELAAGDIRGLATGVVTSWSTGTAQNLYTSGAVNGFVLLHIIARSPSGTQPLTFSVAVNGVTAYTAISLSVLTGTNGIPLFPSSSSNVVIGTTGQSVTVTPISASSGATCTFDLLGYEF